MSILGWFLAVLGFAGLIFGLLQMLKGKKMNAVPFRAPSEIAQLGPQAADAQGLVSTEGVVGQDGILYAPMSGRPCLAFEITIERKWEKSERTENGVQTKKGSSNLFRDYRGGVFSIQDGNGQIFVDASEQPDASFDKTHQSSMDVGLLGLIPGTLQFGNFQMNTPTILDLDSRTVGFEGTEKIIPPSPNLYALGQLNPTPQGCVVATPKGLGTGKLILSQKGRASLVKSTKRNMILGYALGGAMFVGGTVLGIFGPAPDPTNGGTACAATISDAVSCDGRIYERDGKDHTWTVTTAGEYTIVVKQPAVKYPIDATITVKDAKGAQVAYNDGGSPGADAKVKQRFEPGTYTINVRDFARDKVKGGYGFHLDITKEAAPAVSSASITNADIKPADTAPAATPAKAALPVKGGAKGAATAKGKAAAPAKATGDADDAKTAAKAAAPAGGAKKAKAAPADKP
jgi:hypothetical protein